MLLISCLIFAVLFDGYHAWWYFTTTTQAPTQTPGSTGTNTNIGTLGQYNVQTSNISLSGISAGGAFASQFHVAHSNKIMGMGSLAGVPYHCASGSLMTALRACMRSPTSIDVNNLLTYARNKASSGDVDPVTSMYDDKVFIFSGSSDSTVVPGVSRKMEAFYNSVLRPGNIKTVYDTQAGHTFPTDNYGGSCASTTSPYISNCGYNAAYDMLNHIYGGGLIKPATSGVTLQGQFLLFDQTEFPSTTSRKKRQFSLLNVQRQMLNSTLQMLDLGQPWFDTVADYWRRVWGLTGTATGNAVPTATLPGFGSTLSSSASGLDSTGFVYIPSRCVDGQTACKLHVAFHGCLMGRTSINDAFARHAGYNEVAELNNIIILYPQVTPNVLASNPNGCWDWWGYTNSQNYALKTGAQILAVDSMITRMTG